MSVEIKALRGKEIEPWLNDFAALRMTVFRDWPYLYDGSFAYEREYLKPYLADPTAVVVGAFDKGKMIGAATASALSGHKADFAEAFKGHPMSLERVYYLAESVLLPDYRGQGIGHRFFDHREEAAKAQGFGTTAFCAVLRPQSHLLCPQGARSLEPFWRGRGYEPLDGVIARFNWQDVGEAQETEKELQFWARTS